MSSRVDRVPAGAGPTNSIVDVAGIRVGQAERVGDGWRSGVTVVLAPPGGAVGGVDVRGGAPGTRETDLLNPVNLVERVHAVVLSGGSAYGLAAVDGVVGRLADAGIGFSVGTEPDHVVPIVPAAVLYDLGRGGTFRATPDAALGAAAYDAAADDAAATRPPRQGSVGAATGAVAGGLAGGIGTASAVLPGGHTVAALAAVNAAGSPVDPATGLPYGLDCALPAEFALSAPDPAELAGWIDQPPRKPFNTTIGVVATDAALTKAGCTRMATIAHDGLARAIRPVHTMTDGDAIFGLATGTGDPLSGLDLRHVLIAAADCFTRAIVHALLAATDRPAARSYRAAFPSAMNA